MAALLVVWASADRPVQATNNFDISYIIKQCNVLQPGYPDSFKNGAPTGITSFGGADVSPANGVADCVDGTAGTETVAADTVTHQSTILCVPGRVSYTAGGVPCPASSFAPNLPSKNFSQIINYIPSGYQINGRGTDSFPTDVGVGQLVGGGANTVNLTAAVQSNDCSGTFPVPFVFYNIALPNVGTPGAASVFGNPDPRTATNIAWPRLEGATDRFGHWVIGNGTTDPGGHVDNPGDNIVDTGSDDVADPTSPPIINYPKFLLDLFDPDYVPGTGDNADGGNNMPPAVPIAVYGGLSIPTGASADWVPLYFVQFAPGQLANGAGLWTGSHPYAKSVAALGSPNVAILNDPTSVKSSISTIQDFCGMVQSMTVLLGRSAGPDGIVGNGDDVDRFMTPAATGTYFYQNWIMSLRDSDGDGRENGFDTCPWNDDTANYPNPDTDFDGIYDTCEPTVALRTIPGCDDPNVIDLSNIDCDLDNFNNRQDNCPQVANGLSQDGQLESELSVLAWPADGGPKTDGIGDVCDSEGGGSDTVPNGDFQIRGKVTAKCIGGTDADGDGYCAAQDTGFDANVAGNNVRHNAWTSPLTLVDTDADTVGVKSDFQETFMGTDETRRCAADTILNNEGPPDRWGFDFDDNRMAALSDILSYIPVFGSTGPASARWDQNQDGAANLADILAFIPVFGVSCVP